MEQRTEDTKARHIINVGSRKSQLALIQTNTVIERLQQFYLNNESPAELGGEPLQTGHPGSLDEPTPSNSGGLQFNIVAMKTTGDEITDKPLPSIGVKSLFTRELELALLEGRVDFVVHSLKDMPTTLPDGCTLGAILRRDSPEDTVVIKKSLRGQVEPLDVLFAAAGGGGAPPRIGTSSRRRIAMLKRCSPGVACLDIRGNLNTRLAKLDDERAELDAIVLASAGLERMGWSARGSPALSAASDPRLADWCYAVGQGAIAVECRSADRRILDLLRPLQHLATSYETLAERSLMNRLEAGCSVPLGVRSSWHSRERPEAALQLELEAIVLSDDGKQLVRARASRSLDRKCEAEERTGLYETFGTGITLNVTERTRENATSCSSLGVEVANKLIDKGCLKIMRQSS